MADFSRGAARALLGVTRVLTEGGELAITPDGPRGPAKSYAPGVAIIAQRANVPVIAASASTGSAWRLRLGSDDRATRGTVLSGTTFPFVYSGARVKREGRST